MSEYIERERAEIIFRDARLALKPEGCKDWNEYVTRDMMLMNAEQAIHIIPAADVVPVRHGRWELDVLDGTPGYRPVCIVCSECHRINYGSTPYCPNCGAKMDKEKE